VWGERSFIPTDTAQIMRGFQSCWPVKKCDWSVGVWCGLFAWFSNGSRIMRTVAMHLCQEFLQERW
jgi:hypothetical protein